MEFSAKLKGFVAKLKIWAKKFTPVGSQTLKKQACFKRSFLSPCSLKAFYDLFSPKSLIFAQIPPKPNYLDPNNFPWEIFWEFFFGPMGPYYGT